MKLLIAYDGSPHSDAAIDDLAKAGLPQEGEAMIVTVAEVWLPPSGGIDSSIADDRVEILLAHHRSKGEAVIAAAKENAERAEGRVKALLSRWSVSSSATYGSPAWEVISSAEALAADLIVVGSHGQSAISRFFLGSISQKIVSEAKCSVRVARGRNEVDPTPIRVLIGFDSTKGAQAAVEAVAARNWPSQTEVRLLSVIQDASPTIIGKFVPPIMAAVNELNAAEHSILEELAAAAIQALESSGLAAEFHIDAGNAKKTIVEHAEAWSADSIFVGANAFGGRLERFLIGSTSAAVAARAHCSVEVVRLSN